MAKVKIYYDGECPFCSNYVAYLHLQESVGEVVIVNLREKPEVVQEFLERGYDVNEGMVLDLEGKLYHGPEVLTQLALMSTRHDLFNKLNYCIFKKPAIARILYPVLRFGRNVTLFVLRRQKIKPARY
ncbi:MAG: DUF393 domain-containing protein [Alphaproteobacteria bacterium]|nr:DUF393 domain-containing protein [Alphaproteobacteria bacterium]